MNARLSGGIHEKIQSGYYACSGQLDPPAEWPLVHVRVRPTRADSTPWRTGSRSYPIVLGGLLLAP
jgi:hypothetical protein